MKKIIALITLLFFYIAAVLSNTSTTVKNDSSRNELTVSFTPAKISVSDQDIQKQMLFVEKQKASYDSSFSASVEKIVTKLKKIASDPPPLSMIANSFNLPKESIEKSLKLKTIIYRSCITTTLLLSIIYLVVLVLLYKRIALLNWLIHLSIICVINLFLIFVIPDVINTVINPDYEYIKELLRLSG